MAKPNQFGDNVKRPIEGSCKTCIWWNSYNKTEPKYAQCRKLPPTEVPAFKRGSWPETASNDWCANYEQKSEDLILYPQG